jgi:hypothetical protein
MTFRGMGSIVTSRVYPARDVDFVGPIDLELPHLELLPLEQEGQAGSDNYGTLSIRVRGHKPADDDQREILLTAGDVVALRDALNEWLHPVLLTSH